MSTKMSQTVPPEDSQIPIETDNLSPAQHQAIFAMLTTTSIAKAAEEAGVGRSSLYRWLREPVFSRALRELRRSAVRQASALIQHSSANAVAALNTVIDDKKASHASRVSASRTLLSLTYRVLEVDDVEDRLNALEGARFERPPRLPQE